MARIRPNFRPQIDESIAKKLEEKKQQERYYGSMASFVEGILDRYCDGLLVAAEGGATDVRAVRVKSQVKDEHRKVG